MTREARLEAALRRQAKYICPTHDYTSCDHPLCRETRAALAAPSGEPSSHLHSMACALEPGCPGDVPKPPPDDAVGRLLAAVEDVMPYLPRHVVRDECPHCWLADALDAAVAARAGG